MGARPCSSSMDKTCPSGVPFLCSLSQNTSVHRVPMWVSSVGLHLLGNRRKSGRLRYMGKRSPRASQHCRGHPLSSQRGWPVRTNRVCPPNSSSSCLLDHKNRAREAQRSTWCSRGCFAGYQQRKGAAVTHSQRTAAPCGLLHTYFTEILVQSKL